MSDSYKKERKEFTKKIQLFLKELDEPIREAMDKYNLSDLNLMVVPFPKEICKDCSINLVKDILTCIMSNKKYLLISGQFQFVDSLFETLELIMIKNEDYEGIKPLREARKEFQTDEAHYIGHLNF